MPNILFLGDSITDCSHCFSSDSLGNGYVKYISINSSTPSWNITNGGTDGFTFRAIHRKWRLQYASGSYDIVSVLGGINDVGACMDAGLSQGQIQAQLLHSGLALRNLLTDLQKSEVPVILLPEPFLFSYPAYLNTWMGCLEQMRHLIRQTVRQAETSASGTCFRLISLQPALDQYAAAHGLASVTTDGIHLTQTGHRIVGDCILSALSEFTDSLPFHE